jgi:L-alanine-DL-glutamate epimerase-like enolase superfamily enzyme
MLSEAKHLLFLHFYKQILRRFAPQNDRAERLSTEPLELRNGRARVPQRPGLGVELDWAAVEKYRVPLNHAPL